MTPLKKIQKLLDGCLLKDGILSYHQRRLNSQELIDFDNTINPDIYVVYRMLPGEMVHGDGLGIARKKVFEINLYYKFDQNSTTTYNALEILNKLLNYIKSQNIWVIKNDVNDIYDLENSFRGFNFEIETIISERV